MSQVDVESGEERKVEDPSHTRGQRRGVAGEAVATLTDENYRVPDP